MSITPFPLLDQTLATFKKFRTPRFICQLLRQCLKYLSICLHIQSFLELPGGDSAPLALAPAVVSVEFFYRNCATCLRASSSSFHSGLPASFQTSLSFKSCRNQLRLPSFSQTSSSVAKLILQFQANFFPRQNHSNVINLGHVLHPANASVTPRLCCYSRSERRSPPGGTIQEREDPAS